ncbi:MULTISPECIES: LysR family transcriptional regulator [unclassified Streptomyces]|uniref:LysR family transcriptional regulator n=1 Tax=unclassified Streptomyces TaxID=2593676 RepID=UPI00087E2FE7|nr:MULTISPECIES: LysR family transcriptional regulator [unclassified Streptomyces]PBC86904.1 DNA-binding transcriptional LysR family regulator [Streptomyces sp. 2321.6]SDQ68472.1 DNA-binding transcriptional regulator, LysR family [Streptomyces sp. KS_16]SEE13131.1 DNA-binding transcriptional regulator, LysR family [Streptomyces sp. 2133.1]SNC74080.1 DNA-binding transcriptional regulator, LysR family [Streptomyces sp. 2114.4]
MDTRLLRTFVTLARAGSFTATARALHLAQSTVTVQIRTLEKELGTPLFDRMPSGTVPTRAGLRLLEEAEEVLDAVARLRATAAAGQRDVTGGTVEGQVAVGAGDSLCSSRLPAVIASLRHAHPRLDVQLHAAGTATAVDGLRTGRLDIALLLEPEVGESDLLARRIADESLVYVVAPGHPLAGRAADWEELAGESFFVHEEGCSYSDRLVRTLLGLPGASPRITRFGSIDAARSCVAAGLGLTMLPRVTVERHLQGGQLAVVDGPRAQPVPVQLVRHRRRWFAPGAQIVAEELTRTFAKA